MKLTDYSFSASEHNVANESGAQLININTTFDCLLYNNLFFRGSAIGYYDGHRLTLFDGSLIPSAADNVFNVIYNHLVKNGYMFITNKSGRRIRLVAQKLFLFSYLQQRIEGK